MVAACIKLCMNLPFSLGAVPNDNLVRRQFTIVARAFRGHALHRAHNDMRQMKSRPGADPQCNTYAGWAAPPRTQAGIARKVHFLRWHRCERGSIQEILFYRLAKEGCRLDSLPGW